MPTGIYKHKPLSKETKIKISNSLKGKIRSKEHRKNLGLALKGKHPNTEFKNEGKGKLKRRYKRFNGKFVTNAHFIWFKFNNVAKISRGYVIHHKDGDSLNDDINNLILMKDLKHRRLHYQISKNKGFKL